MLLPAAFLPAQSREDSLRSLDEVVVVADRRREVIPPQRLAGEKLAALAAFSVADAIRYFSGIQIKDYGGIGGLKTVDIRSMGTNHLGVFYDGLPLGNAQNGQIDLGKFSLDNIEEIALYFGQKSEILQPARDYGSAGAVYLRTRRPRFDGEKKNSVAATFRTGSFQLLNPSAIWERKLGARTSASVNTEFIYASGKYPFRYRKVLPDKTVAWDTTAIRLNGDVRSLRAEPALYGSTDGGMWHLKAYFYDSEKGIPGAIVNNVWKRSQRQWDRNFFVQGSFRQRFFDRGEALANIKFADDYMRYLNPDTALMYIDNNFRQKEVYASTAFKYSPAAGWDVSLSADYQWNTLAASLQDFAFPRRHTALAAIATAVDRPRLKMQASLLGTFVAESVSPKDGLPLRQDAPAGKRIFTPAVFVSFSPLRNFAPLRLRAFYKHIFRMPTFNDLYYTDVGNIALRPEYTRQFNAGVSYDSDGVLSLRLQADAYCNEVTDKIIAVPKGNGQYRWMMMNLGFVKIRGVDFAARAGCPLPGDAVLDARINYTFQLARDFSDPRDSDPDAGSYGGQIAYIPRHSASTVVHVRRRSWELNYSFIYVGERFHNSSNIRENREPPWYTHDLALAKSFRFAAAANRASATLRVAAEINNVFNQFYDVVLNYPMPGRNYKLIFKLSL
jgi:outer membrane cobalamin receptor